VKSLAIIPARGGSKGLPRKNVLPLNGKPLIQYTIEAARAVFDDSDICVSTDDLEIVEVVRNLGLELPFIRPDILAEDHSTTQDVIIHALEFYKNKGVDYDSIVLLQPTSPLRKANHIVEALSLYNADIDMVVSVKETDSNPYYVLFEENHEGYLQKSKVGDFTRRQDCPKVWEYNGALYIVNKISLLKKPIYSFDKVVKFVMDAKSSVDIDNEIDLKIAEYLMKRDDYKYDRIT
jgi:CMP-N,N'-diacetyllegionaminic acid synthase